MDIKDTTANLTSIAGMSMSMLNIEMVLTVAVLISALILNISRLIALKNKVNKKDE
tara:strand:+ start:619 stop:786 length:168 start_codon:yes stop_codon:yes gene_type:complete